MNLEDYDSYRVIDQGPRLPGIVHTYRVDKAYLEYCIALTIAVYLKQYNTLRVDANLSL